MSFLSSIFSPSSGTPANGGAPAPALAAAPAAPATPPAAPAAPAAEASPTASLDAFTSLWQTATNADGTPKAPAADPTKAPIYNFDAAKVVESANKMDFAGSVAPELFTKALGGDPLALADIINQSVRQAVVGMTMSQGQLINQAVATNNERFASVLPQHINRAKLMEADDNPVFSHPAAQPLVQSLKQMAYAKDPNASPAAISKQVSDYLAGFAAAMTEASPQRQAEVTQAKAGQTDWSKW